MGTIHTSDGVIESLLGQLASLVRGVENLVVEDREVQGETQTNGVCGREALLCDLSGGLVGLERLVGGLLALVANGEFSEVAVVIALPRVIVSNCGVFALSAKNLHLVVEHLGLAALGRRDQVLVQALQDILADLGKLVLDLLAVLLDKGDLGLVALGLLLLLNRGNDSPGGAASTDDVLVCDGQEVALLNGKFLVCRGHHLHVLDHLYAILAPGHFPGPKNQQN